MWDFRNKVKLHILRKSPSLKGLLRIKHNDSAKPLCCASVCEKSGMIPGFLLFIWNNMFNVFNNTLLLVIFLVILWNSLNCSPLEYQIFAACRHAIRRVLGEMRIYLHPRAEVVQYVNFYWENACFKLCTALRRMALCVAGIGISVI